MLVKQAVLLKHDKQRMAAEMEAVMAEAVELTRERDALLEEARARRAAVTRTRGAPVHASGRARAEHVWTGGRERGVRGRGQRGYSCMHTCTCTHARSMCGQRGWSQAACPDCNTWSRKLSMVEVGEHVHAA